MKPIGIALLATAMLALTATPGMAQYVVAAKSGTVNFTEGQVQLDGHDVESSLTHYPDIKEGSVLRTDEGRAEVLLTPGVTLRLGDHASFKMLTNRLIDTRLELLGGSAVVEADDIAKDTSVTIVVNGAAVSLPKAGIYRFSFEPSQLKVFKGEAAVLAGSETTPVGAGRMCALGGTPAVVKKFDMNDTDALDHWSHRRGELMAMANVSGANSYNSGTGSGSYSPYYSLGIGMPYMGCSGLGYMPFGYYGSGFWGFNNYYGMYTYIPCGGMAYSPYGYGYWSPGMVQGIVGPAGGVNRTGLRGPVRGPVNLPGRVPLVLALNGSHTPGFRGGTGSTSAYSAAGRSGFGSAAGRSGFGGAAGGYGAYTGGSLGGYSGSAAASGSVAGGGVGGGAASHGGFAGGGGAAAGGGAAGGGHR